jgi:hypothetical protein
MHDHATAFTIGAFVLGLLLLPTLRWVDATWFALLSKIFDPRDASFSDEDGAFPDEDEDDYLLFTSATNPRIETLPRDVTSKVDKLRVTPR